MSKKRKTAAVLLTFIAIIVGTAFILNGQIINQVLGGGGSLNRKAPGRVVPFVELKRPDFEIDRDSWELILINANNPIPDDFVPRLAPTSDGFEFDERAVEALENMLSDGREAGKKLVLSSAYRSFETQTTLHENRILRAMEEQGLSYEDAVPVAASIVARPGTSEHQTGLAVDIVSEDYEIMDSGYAATPEARWLKEHCADYGFILRYGKNQTEITGIIYEPWHFRYVGVEAAEFIMDNKITFEEFLELYE